jgi:hypothetical protein
VFELEGLLIIAFGAVFDYGLVDVVVRWLFHGDTTRTYIYFPSSQADSIRDSKTSCFQSTTPLKDP